MLRAYRVLTGGSRHAFHSQNPTSSQKKQVTLPLSFCHMLKCPKVIELDIPWRTLVVAYLIHALKIQMTHCNGQRKVEGTVAEISNTHARLLSSRELCHGCARQIL